MASHKTNAPIGRQPSCLSCHRRKLKCGREPEGCENCRNTDDSCTYPAPEARVRQKRGSYQKSRNKREHELENAVKAIERKYEALAAKLQTNGAASSSNGVSTSSIYGESPRSNDRITPPEGRSHSRSSGNSYIRTASIPYESAMVPPKEHAGSHPSTSRTLDHWHTYATKVDPLIKIIHRPSFGKMLFNAQEDTFKLDSGLQALLFSICFASVTSLTPEEIQSRFGEDQNSLLERYRSSLEACLIVEQGKRRPSMASLQGLVIYLICRRRQDGENKLWSLYGLALRMAQLIGVDSESECKSVPFFEGQMRRRLWWHLCWLEKRYAEDHMSHSASIMDWSDVTLPLNLNDGDLDPDVTVSPQPRSGFTDMTMSLIRFDLVKTNYELANVQTNHYGEDHMTVFARKASILDEAEARMFQHHLQFCDSSRPFDRVVLSITNVLLMKGKLVVQKAFSAVAPMENNEEETFKICLDILEMSYSFQNDHQLDEWKWIYQDSVQIPSLVQVVSMLGQNNKRLDTKTQQRALVLCEESVSRLPAHEKQGQRGERLLAMITRARQVVPNQDASLAGLPIPDITKTSGNAMSKQPIFSAEPAMTNTRIDETLLPNSSTDPMLGQLDWDNVDLFLDDASFSLDTF